MVLMQILMPMLMLLMLMLIMMLIMMLMHSQRAHIISLKDPDNFTEELAGKPRSVHVPPVQRCLVALMLLSGPPSKPPTSRNRSISRR